MNIPESYLLSNKLDKMVKHPLSDNELKTILGKDAKIVMYPDLAKYSTLEQLLPNPLDYCIILIVESENKFNISGHWTALLKYNGIYEYFDPYGNDVDVDLINWMDKKTRLRLHEDKPYLTFLLKGRNYIYNKVKYELLRKGVNTCGSHSSYRIYQFKKYNLTLEQYHKHMLDLSKQYGIGFDKIVASFVSFFLK
jgi:hypothetical protein